ncbi:hypothetical protein AY599_14665 [Leptolyngbya valderiana BDU 20041]|nr:hypothetical protein AY599_14665 [Leptolyngbya valderiana BDU 20041]
MSASFPGSALKLASALEERTRRVTLAESIPALVAHPDWEAPAPLVLWMHGRTSRKEIDSGRYLRLIRAGIAVCAIDLPGHGDRPDAALQAADGTIEMLRLAQPEVDVAIKALLDGEHGGVFDRDKLGIGGISAGGMVTLRRLCEPHGFSCAAVEATTGWLEGLYFPRGGNGGRWPVDHSRAAVEAVDPTAHLDGFEPLPLMAMHSEADELVPFSVQREFIEQLRKHYEARGADPSLVELVTWPETGAPQEHLGFGRHAHEAKNIQVDFFKKHLLGPDE